jgi:DNA-3-methyladenine glycosylase II
MEVVRLYLVYGETEIAHLSARDPKLGEAIRRIGPVRREADGDLFSSVTRHILGQQVSSAALATLWKRLLERAGEPTPEGLLRLGEGGIQALGTSHRKAGYLYAFAQRVHSGAFSMDALAAATDAEATRMLAAERGMGVWTAEMVLLFGLGRPNIVSYGDLGIRRGMRMLYRHRALPPETFARHARRYAPYGSVASLYLWAISAGALPELTDPAAPARKEKAHDNKSSGQVPHP